MTVKELIEALQKYDPTALVVTRGMDEHGYSDMETIESVLVEPRKSSICDYEKSNGSPKAVQAVLVDHF